MSKASDYGSTLREAFKTRPSGFVGKDVSAVVDDNGKCEFGRGGLVLTGIDSYELGLWLVKTFGPNEAKP